MKFIYRFVSLVALACAGNWTAAVHADLLFVVNDGGSVVNRYSVSGPGKAPVFMDSLPSDFNAWELTYGDGDLYIANRVSNTITHYTGVLGPSPVALANIDQNNPTGPSFDSPHGVAHGGPFGNGDELFVTPGTGTTIANLRRFTVTPGVSAVTEGAGSPQPTYTPSRDVVVSPWGELFLVTSSSAFLGGVPAVVRYTFGPGGFAYNGEFSSPTFNNPHGIAFSPWGELFVANANNTISRFSFTSTGTAGTPVPGVPIAIPGSGLSLDLKFSVWNELWVSRNYASAADQNLYVFDFAAPVNAAPTTGMAAYPIGYNAAGITFSRDAAFLVPEPSSVLLAATGGLLLLVCAWRQRAKILRN
jgi:hypothetical protein